MKRAILVLGDVFCFYFSLFLTLFLRYSKFDFSLFSFHLFPFSVLLFFFLLIFYIFDLYQFFSKREFLSKTFIPFLICFFISLFLFYFFYPIFKISPKTNLFLFFTIFTLSLFFWRQIFYFVFSKTFLRKVFFGGQRKEIEELKSFLKENPALGFQVTEEKENSEILVFDKNNFPWQEYLKKDVLLFTLDEFYEMIFKKIPINLISEEWFLKVKKKNLEDKLKRIFDLIFSLFLIILFFPFWFLIPLLIFFEDGRPIFYLQERVGKDNKIFKLIKFRSMRKDAEKAGPQWAKVKDERITRVGKILRKFHLDEIPQLFNVLKGEMSLVGPRAERPEFVEILKEKIPFYEFRHIIKPGITGWAQINFGYARSVEDSLKKFEYDLYYIKNRSLLLDLKILLKTFQIWFRHP
jgi:lipopolysaccharide/colanic/teichoic acid biosynthesis glycosyltransferase